MKRTSLAGFTAVAVIGLVYTAMYTTIGETTKTGDLSEYIEANAISVVSSDTLTEYNAFMPEETVVTKSTTARTDITVKTDKNPVSTLQGAEGSGNIGMASQLTMAAPTTTPKVTTTPRVTTTPKVTTTPRATTTPKVTTTPVTTTTPKATTTTVPETTTEREFETKTTAATTVPTTETTTVPTTTTPKATTTTVPQSTAMREFGQTTTEATTKATTKATEAEEEIVSSSWGNLTYKYNGSTHTDDAYTVVCKVVEAEMGSSFDEEALKAQAVAAYSFIKSKNNSGVAPSLSMKSNVSQKVKSAVSAVSGEAIYYNGKVIEAVYSASQGGASAGSEQVWGGKIPYLASVENDYDDEDTKHYGYEKTFTKSQVKSYLESYLGSSPSSDPDEWIVIESRYDSGYVNRVTIDGRKTVTGRTVREEIFDFDLKSANFEVEYDDGEFIFTTYGYGHGVGLSQIGANLYAKHGYDYIEILEHYYTGVTVR